MIPSIFSGVRIPADHPARILLSLHYHHPGTHSNLCDKPLDKTIEARHRDNDTIIISLLDKLRPSTASSNTTLSTSQPAATQTSTGAGPKAQGGKIVRMAVGVLFALILALVGGYLLWLGRWYCVVKVSGVVRLTVMLVERLRG
jgi:hypothetical protein